MSDVDAIVIGSGQGGVPFAVDLAKSGKKVVLFERGRLGGSCVNYGCTPSKAFLAAAHAAGRARDAAKLGIHVAVTVDFPAVMERVRAIRDEWTAGVEDKVRAAKLVLVSAEAKFSGERTVTGGGQTYSAPLVVINTGTSALVPPVAGLADVPYLTNESFFAQRTLPATFLVMGGGYIGLELGQGMARLGSRVHIIDPGPHVLGREESDAAEMLQRGLERDGVELH
ncbi:MAG: FAD-dependent oxidoreductase, partial [Candidatus Eremiobacteraeota bacterium]|nr:FAD-dependent oxidoreductase [Candidatus Eremiobacteraeota bacterium]